MAEHLIPTLATSCFRYGGKWPAQNQFSLKSQTTPPKIGNWVFLMDFGLTGIPQYCGPTTLNPLIGQPRLLYDSLMVKLKKKYTYCKCTVNDLFFFKTKLHKTSCIYLLGKLKLRPLNTSRHSWIFPFYGVMFQIILWWYLGFIMHLQWLIWMESTLIIAQKSITLMYKMHVKVECELPLHWCSKSKTWGHLK